MVVFERFNYKDKKTWLKGRLRGIGGSEASACLNLNPYKSQRDLVEYKLKIKKEVFNGDPEIVEYGSKAEEHIRELWKLENKKKYEVYHKENEILQNKEIPFLIGSLDGEITEKDTKRKGVLEIKTARINSAVTSQKWKGGVPDNYYIQVLHYLLVTNYDFAIIVAELRYEIDGKVWFKRVEYKIERSEVEEDLKELLEAEQKTWDYVEKKEVPNLQITF